MEWVVIRSTHRQQRLSVHFPVVNSFICSFIIRYYICLFSTLSTALEKSLSASNCHIKVALYFICVRVFSVLPSIFDRPLLNFFSFVKRRAVGRSTGGESPLAWDAAAAADDFAPRVGEMGGPDRPAIAYLIWRANRGPRWVWCKH